jgi:hypothetical protein
MVIADGWTCRVCWKANRAQDPVCYRCKSPRDLTVDEAAAQRKAIADEEAKRAAVAGTVPDLVVALPVVVFRVYAKAWRRGGVGMLAVPMLMVLTGIPDFGYILLSGGLAVGLVLGGIAAGEVIDGMREREAWAFIFGIVLAIIGLVGTIVGFQLLAPGLIHPTTVRWGSVIVFGGAGLAALSGLVMLYVRRPLPPLSASSGSAPMNASEATYDGPTEGG